MLMRASYNGEEQQRTTLMLDETGKDLEPVIIVFFLPGAYAKNFEGNVVK